MNATVVTKYLYLKRLKIAHEDIKLYCHFFNNDKVCLKGEECVFLHEESDICRYGDICDRINYMFRLVEEENYTSDEVDIDEEENANEEDVKNESESNNDNDEDEVHECDQTFMNPSQSDKSDSENVDQESLKCDYCGFIAPEHKRLERHILEIHSNTTKFGLFLANFSVQLYNTNF